MNSPPATDHSSPSTALQLHDARSPRSRLDASHTSAYAQRFIIPTKTDSLSSGFPYHPRLHDLGVSLDEWHLFTSDVVDAGKLTLQEDWAAWSTGIGAGTLTFIFVLGPWAGYIAGKSVHKKVVVNKVKERLLKDGDMRSVLRRWNEGTFARKGFQAWLELPEEGDLGDLSPSPTIKENKTKKEKKKEEKALQKEKRRFKINIIPENIKQGFPWSDTGSTAQMPTIPFVEAPQAEHKSPVEMHTASSNHIQPLVNHQQEINPEGERDIKHEYRSSVPSTIKPDHDTHAPHNLAEERGLGPVLEVANGRIPESEVIPEDEKKSKDSPYNYPAAFEMDSG